MNARFWRFAALTVILLGMDLATSGTLVSPATAAPVAQERYIIQPLSSADYATTLANIPRTGGHVIAGLPQVNLIIATLPENFSRTQVYMESNWGLVAKDGIRKLIRPEQQKELWGNRLQSKPLNTAVKLNVSKPATPPANSGLGPIIPDPAYFYLGLLWNLDRIGAPYFWGYFGAGLKNVQVGVADTGLDYTHPELSNGKVASVVDLTYLEEPFPICETYFGPPTPDFTTGAGDVDLATLYGGPADGDWNGHGTWIGGNIAGNLDTVGLNGIVPDIQLVSLKISQWCGSAYDSEILTAFVKGADMGLDVISISFGGYMDRRNPYEDALYQQYVRVVGYAKTKGTAIVASAGNEHVRIDAKGKVVSHGSLTAPGDTVSDLYGWYQTPAGIPGVVMVSATGNVVNPLSTSCAPSDMNNSNATCKPTSDKHKPFGVNKQDQLAYYSNYGPRVDIAGPGGARMFNLPGWDRGGTPGFPYTFTGGPYSTSTWQDFSITSDWALEIPCWLISDGTNPNGFYYPHCYSTIQGTSMATPHVSAVLAMIASLDPNSRHSPDAQIYLLKQIAKKQGLSNSTPPLSASDRAAGDLTGILCPKGYCHLGGSAISFKEAYGAGLVQAPY